MKRICEGCGWVNDATDAGVVCCSGYRNWEVPLARMMNMNTVVTTGLLKIILLVRSF